MTNINKALTITLLITTITLFSNCKKDQAEIRSELESTYFKHLEELVKTSNAITQSLTLAAGNRAAFEELKAASFVLLNAEEHIFF